MESKSNSNIIKGEVELGSIQKIMQLNPSFKITRKSESNSFYEDCMRQYNDYIEMVAKLMREIHVTDNSIVFCKFIHQLLKDGFFSENHKFYSNDTWFLDIDENYYGMEIVAGRGCCRHIGFFYDDLFTQLRIPNRVVPCYCFSDQTQYKRDNSKEANHVFNLISYQGTLYGYDGGSDTLLQSLNSTKMIEICSPEHKHDPDFHPYCFYYKPSCDREMFHLSHRDILKRLLEFKKNSGRDTIDYQQILEFNEQVSSMIHDHQCLLDDFDEETKQLKKDITYHMKLGKYDYIDYHYH